MHAHAWLLIRPSKGKSIIKILKNVATECGLQMKEPLDLGEIRSDANWQTYGLESHIVQVESSAEVEKTCFIGGKVEPRDASRKRFRWHVDVFEKAEEALRGPAAVTMTFGILFGHAYAALQRRRLFDSIALGDREKWWGTIPPAIPKAITMVGLERCCSYRNAEKHKDRCSGTHFDLERSGVLNGHVFYTCRKCNRVSYRPYRYGSRLFSRSGADLSPGSERAVKTLLRNRSSSVVRIARQLAIPVNIVPEVLGAVQRRRQKI